MAAMQPKVYNATKSLQCSHKFTMQPQVYNAAISLQCNQKFTMQPKFSSSVTFEMTPALALVSYNL